MVYREDSGKSVQCRDFNVKHNNSSPVTNQTTDATEKSCCDQASHIYHVFSSMFLYPFNVHLYQIILYQSIFKVMCFSISVPTNNRSLASYEFGSINVKSENPKPGSEIFFYRA